jgi:uncharacterized membrane protein
LWLRLRITYEIGMTLFALVIQTLAFYLLYNASKRVRVRNDAFSAWLQGHALFSKIAGLVLLAVAFSLFVVVEGLGVGVFMGFLALMTVSSLIVLFAPLKFKN